MSELKPGDIISMSVAPRVRLTQYVSVHAHASVKRALGEDPEEDVARMEASLTRLSHRAIAIELGVLSSLTKVVSEMETIEEIAQHCLDVWEHGEKEDPDEGLETEYQEGEIKVRRKARKKARKKKGKRKARRKT